MGAEVIAYHDAVASFERDRAVYDLRLRGLSDRKIAEHLKLGIEQVRAGVARMQGDFGPDTRRTNAKLQAERLDEMMIAHYAKACEGDVMATKLVLEMMDRQAKLMGLDAPANGSNVFEAAINQGASSTEQLRQAIKLVVSERKPKPDDGPTPP